MVLSALGRPIEGQRHFVEAGQCDPDDAGAHFALGDALLEDHRPAEALSHYEAALRLQPERAAALHASMGDALSRLGRPAEAIRNYETALRLNPDNDRARENLARIRAAAERHGGRKK
jgi:tetratricopeptide (TPR) repeat protein